MITEKQYLDALDIVKEYAKQVEEQTAIALQQTTLGKQEIEKDSLQKLKKEVANMTIDELYESSNIESVLKVMPVRLYNCLKAVSYSSMYPSDYFCNKKLCDIQKRQFLKLRNVGLYSWICLCEITGNEV
jgi:hypothetical protein